MRRADRLFQIVQHLRARRLTTAAQLAEYLSVSERTIYRDVRDLSLSSIPVKGEAGVGYCLDHSFELTALMFTPEEVESVVVGLRMAKAFGGPRLRAAAVPALDKVILALPKNRRAEVDRPQMYASSFNSHRSTDELLESIRSAIDERAVIKLKYADDQNRESERTVRPLALHFWGSVWTSTAWCNTREDFRNFRLDRLRSCIRTGDSFVDEPGKTLDDFLNSVGVG
jgi:predicted DNA-binding transcriptional regulator YafY